MIKRIGILTSGGDSPGMNAAIRAIVKTAICSNLEIFGIYNGYLGLYKNEMISLNEKHVSNIINHGGTFLGSSRFSGFLKKDIRCIAAENLKKNKIEVLIVIGGDGSYLGAQYLTEMGFPCIGIPGTIDNDVVGTDYTIGYFTALETIVEAINKLHDTSSSHQRISIVEIMGRYCGDLTLAASIAGGCDFFILPKTGYKKEKLLENIKNKIKKGKKHIIIAVTEHICNVNELAIYIQKNTNRETRATILGHIQRGGSPVVYDKILASRMGVYSVNILLEGFKGRCIGICQDKMINYDIKSAFKNMTKKNKYDWLDTAKKLC